MKDLVIPDNIYTPTSLELPSDLEFDDWMHRGKMLMRLMQSGPFWIGDWLNFGEKTYGEKYAQAVEVTGCAIDTLRKYQWVTEQVPPERRRESLMFGHHDAVAALPPAEQDKILDDAQENEWTVSETRTAASKKKAPVERPEKPVDCPSCGFDLTAWLDGR